MKGITEEAWEGYVASVYGGPLQGRQLMECRRCFYAGAWATLNKVSALAEKATEAEMMVMETIFLELEQFKADVAAGRK